MDVQVSIQRSFLFLLAFAVACDVNGIGLNPYGAVDGGMDTKSEALCPNGLMENANWLLAVKDRSCDRRCGPDDLGTQVCRPVDLKTCQETKECVCATPPCTACSSCTILSIPTCYQPTNVDKPNRCSVGVVDGGACTPACSRLLCLLSNGKTGCVCNSNGIWTCASWSQHAWR